MTTHSTDCNVCQQPSNFHPSHHLYLRTYRWRSPVPASCLLQSVFGLIYSSGVFIALLQSPSYTLAVGIAGFFISIGILCGGIFISRVVPTSQFQSAPTYAAIIGAVSLYAQSLMALALVHQLDLLLFAAAAILGFGCGCLYVASVDVLQSWVPNAPGLVTGLGMLCGGVGSLIGIPLYANMSAWLGGPVPAMAVAGLSVGTLSLASACLVHRAPRDWDGYPQQAVLHHVRAEDESNALLPSSQSVWGPSSTIGWPALNVGDVLKESSFYYLSIAFAGIAGPGFGVVLAFQSMVSRMFGVDADTANRLFFWVTLSGLVGRLVSGMAVDALQKAVAIDKRDMLTGARLTNIILLSVQIVGFLSLPTFIAKGYVTAFTFAMAVVYVTFSGGAVVAACLARGIFMPNNFSLVFSLLAISIGFGDVFFSWTVASPGQNSTNVELQSQQLFHQEDYNLYIFCGVLWSVLGFIASFLIRVANVIKNCKEIPEV